MILKAQGWQRPLHTINILIAHLSSLFLAINTYFPPLSLFWTMAVFVLGWGELHDTSSPFLGLQSNVVNETLTLTVVALFAHPWFSSCARLSSIIFPLSLPGSNQTVEPLICQTEPQPSPAPAMRGALWHPQHCTAQREHNGRRRKLRSLQCQSIRHLFHEANVGLWFRKTSGTWLSIPWSF